MLGRTPIVTLLVLFLSGCAGVDVVKITPDNTDQDGIRFYRPYPYLWVTLDKENHLQGTITWLPKTDEQYAIRVKSGLGSAEVKCKLADGWNLTEFGDVRESNIPETFKALTGSLADLAGLRVAPGGEELHPGLYLFLFDETTGLVSGIKPVLQFR